MHSTNSPKSSPKLQRAINESQSHPNEASASTNQIGFFSSSNDQSLISENYKLSGPILIAEDVDAIARNVLQSIFNTLNNLNVSCTIPLLQKKRVDIKKLRETSEIFLCEENVITDKALIPEIIWLKDGNEIIAAMKKLKEQNIKPLICIFDDEMPKKKGSIAVLELSKDEQFHKDKFEEIIYMCSSTLDQGSNLPVKGYIEKPVGNAFKVLFEEIIKKDQRMVENRKEEIKKALAALRKKSW